MLVNVFVVALTNRVIKYEFVVAVPSTKSASVRLVPEPALYPFTTVEEDGPPEVDGATVASFDADSTFSAVTLQRSAPFSFGAFVDVPIELNVSSIPNWYKYAAAGKTAEELSENAAMPTIMEQTFFIVGLCPTL